MHKLGVGASPSRGGRVARILAALAVVGLLVAVFVAARSFAVGRSEKTVLADVAAARESFSAGNSQTALVTLERALDADPGNAEANALLGRIREGEGRLDEAVSAYKTSLEADSDQAELRHRIAVIYKSRGDVQEAIAELEKAVALDGSIVGSRLLLAELYEAEGDNEDAVAQLDAIIELAPIGVDLDEIEEWRRDLE